MATGIHAPHRHRFLPIMRAWNTRILHRALLSPRACPNEYFTLVLPVILNEAKNLSRETFHFVQGARTVQMVMICRWDA